MRDSLRRWRYAIGIGVVVLIVLAAASFVLVTQGQAAPLQPIAFPHVTMVQAGIPCLFCHADAMRSPVAGIPSVDKCMGCHKTIGTTTPIIQQVTGYYARNEAIPWMRVNRLPRFVYFTHRVHIAQGLNCERCHGDVGHMTVDVPVANMNMGWCLGCHEQQSNAQQLQDCVVCHQ